MNELSEYDLIQRFKAGNSQALNVILTRHAGVIYMMIQRYANEHSEYEDLYQTSVERIIKSLDRYNPEKAKFNTFIGYVIRGAVSHYQARESKHLRPIPIDAPLNDNNFTVEDVIPDESIDLENDIIQRLHNRELIEILSNKLRPKYALVFKLRYELGMTFTQIGDNIGLSTEATRKIVCNINSQLKSLVSDSYFG